jgi:hypothetical protein
MSSGETRVFIPAKSELSFTSDFEEIGLATSSQGHWLGY